PLLLPYSSRLTLFPYTTLFRSEQGDPTFAAYACRNLISILLASADPLDHVECEAEHGIEFARTVRFEFAVDMISVPLAFVRTLRDRKSTRLNSSHGSISYAVFC